MRGMDWILKGCESMDEFIYINGVQLKNKIKTESFYKKVKECKHKRLRDNGVYPSSCDCFGISEYHCLDCGVWINKCGCERYNAVSGKSLMQRRDQVKGKDWRDVVDDSEL